MPLPSRSGGHTSLHNVSRTPELVQLCMLTAAASRNGEHQQRSAMPLDPLEGRRDATQRRAQLQCQSEYDFAVVKQPSEMRPVGGVG
jgi:hypothetical protein